MSQPPSTLQISQTDLPPLKLHRVTIAGQVSPKDSDSDSFAITQGFKSDDVTRTTLHEDTIHYLSPASPISIRTVCEGDYYDYVTPSFVHLVKDIRGADEGSFETSIISCVEPELQRTIAIVKPEAMPYEDVVLRAINESGFSIIHARHIQLTPEQVSEVYAKHYGSPDFPNTVVGMSMGPVLVLSLAAVNGVNKWKDMVGPSKVIPEEWFFPLSMRKKFGLKETMPNVMHSSENLHESNKENRYFFPENTLEPLVMENEKVWDYCNLYVNTTLLDGLTELVRVKPIEPILFLAEWLLLNNPFQPRYPNEIAVLPT